MRVAVRCRFTAAVRTRQDDVKWEQRDKKICIWIFLVWFDWRHFLGFLSRYDQNFDEKSVCRGVGLDYAAARICRVSPVACPGPHNV